MQTLLRQGKIHINKLRNMSCFTQVLNPITGQSEWQSQCEDYDYHQEVARSAFADMLHDSERNQKYYAALKKTINNLHNKGLKANVLDIGTGTGILSMMAVKSGADSVTACEAFLPMAHCAEKIIKENGMSDAIKLIKKRSTDIVISPDGDMSERANVLVTEVFDTELIGEGAIGIFNHARQKLLTDDCIIIPHSATVYAQVVESPLAASWNKLKMLPNLDGEPLLKTPEEITQCQGECAVHDIQLSQLNTSMINLITEPLAIFDFNWSSKDLIPTSRTNFVKTSSNKHAIAEVVFFWWDLKMDVEGEIILSCAPYWAHQDFKKCAQKNGGQKPVQNSIPWRDHWMQALYYLPKATILASRQEFYLQANHDEYSFWFDICNTNVNKKLERFACTCGFHIAYSRSRIGQINNNIRNKKYLRILEEVITKDSKVLSISDGSLIGLSTAALGAAKVTCLEAHSMSHKALELYIKYNELQNVKLVKCLDEIEDIEEITHVVAEPSFVTSILPWDNFYFGTLLSKIKSKLKSDVFILPVKARIYALPVEFLDLHKIRSPLGICEGFDLSVFDKFVDNSSKLADANVEAQPLWEYPCKAIGKEQYILSVDFNNYNEIIEKTGSIKIECNASCNGVALWVDWILDNSKISRAIVSTGPQLPTEIGSFVSWDLFTRQGVHLFSQPKIVSSKNNVKWKISFKPQEGNLQFHFEIV